MATLTKNTPREYPVSPSGDEVGLPIIASDIIWEGSAVGKVDASGHMRPLQQGDKFVGFELKKVDNSDGSAADLDTKMRFRGFIKLSVTGAVITDVGQPVYASDDDTFTFKPCDASNNRNPFIGKVHRFVSAGVVIVEFGEHLVDPYKDTEKLELISANKTLDAQDSGKTFFVDTDAVVITLPATTTGLQCKIVNIGAFGGILVSISPQATDKIFGADLAGTDNKDLLNTKATARRGDFVEIKDGHADGYQIVKIKGTWATEV